MRGTDGQRATSPPSVHISWTLDEGDVVRLSERPESSTAIIPVHGQATRSKQVSTSRKENLPMDELPSVLEEANLQYIS